MTDECQELKNIKYQTMLLNGNSKIDSNKQNTANLEEFLQKENASNKKQPWSKLGRSTKLKKIALFVNEFSEENKIPIKEKLQLSKYLISCLHKKKLQRVKDVIYDVKNEKIKTIPGLKFNKIKKKFTLRNLDKKKSTLKGLPPKKNKNKIDIHLKEDV
jgi:hypothetical protein|tara:strand:- start:1093 stop:1569 length:477 start_codon:yes stop_codon:yes gene_type:complete